MTVYRKTTQEDKDEAKLAKRIRKRWAGLTDGARAELNTFRKYLDLPHITVIALTKRTPDISLESIPKKA